MSNKRALFLSFLIAGCAERVPAARPHDMGAAAHDRAAVSEGQAAQRDDLRAQKSKAEPTEHCRQAGPSLGDEGGEGVEVCWTTGIDGSADFAARAAAHRKHGAGHRAASASLRALESRVCAGVSEEDRDISPFERAGDIVSVDPLMESTSANAPPRMAGAIVVFRPVSGLSVRGMQRLLDCHLARNGELGYPPAETLGCPLAMKGVEARAATAPLGVVVVIRAADDATSKEILNRAQQLSRSWLRAASN